MWGTWSGSLSFFLNIFFSVLSFMKCTVVCYLSEYTLTVHSDYKAKRKQTVQTRVVGGRLRAVEGEHWQKGMEQELCSCNLRHPLHSINSNTAAQMMHENPFAVRAGGKTSEEMGIDTKDG